MNRIPLPAEPFAHQAGERLTSVSPGAGEAVLSRLPAGDTVQSGERPVGLLRNGGIGRAYGETVFLFTQIPSVRNRTKSETVLSGAGEVLCLIAALSLSSWAGIIGTLWVLL